MWMPPITVQVPGRCVSRVWGGGRGGQCKLRPTAGSEFCSTHLAQCRASSSGWETAHGRVDGPVPPQKIACFEWAEFQRISAIRAAQRMRALSPRLEAPGIGSPPPSQPSQSVPALRISPAGASQSSPSLGIESAPGPPSLSSHNGTCIARVCSEGRGGQCSRSVVPGVELCATHRRQAASLGGLAHGRIAGDVPVRKRAAFALFAGSASDQQRSASRSSSPSRAAECTTAAYATVTGPYMPPFGRLSEDSCAFVLASLRQSEMFRAACTCRALAVASALPRLYRYVDLRQVGVDVSARGRVRRSTDIALKMAVLAFLSQQRFAQARVLDFRGVHMGDGTDIFPLLATYCPCARLLRLGEPKRLLSNIGRLMSTTLERSLAEWWGRRPPDIEAYGRIYRPQASRIV
jgi:hypothetical protein